MLPNALRISALGEEFGLNLRVSFKTLRAVVLPCPGPSLQQKDQVTLSRYVESCKQEFSAQHPNAAV
jgi:hypothetical protein